VFETYERVNVKDKIVKIKIKILYKIYREFYINLNNMVLCADRATSRNIEFIF